jgi:hypothetical protein
MFCQHCGSPLGEEVRFCTSCGTPVAAGAAVVPPDPVQVLQNHLSVLSILWVVYSASRILMAVWTIVFSRFFLPMVGSMIPSEVNVVPMLRFMSGVYWVAGVFAAGMGLLGLWAAWALWQRDPSGRAIALVVAFVSLVSIPFGTAIGVYTLVVLLPQTAAQVYARLPKSA